jgi:hypothetical protein
VTRTAALATLAASAACVLPLAALQAVELTPASRVVEAARPAVQAAATPAQPTVVSSVERAQPKPIAPAVRERPIAAPVSAAADARPVPNPPPAPNLSPGTLAGASENQLRSAIERADPGLYAEIIRAAAEIKSDTGRRLVLMELLTRRDLSRDNLVAIIEATRTMQSDTERRLVLHDVLHHQAFTGGQLPASLFESMAAFTSSTEQRLVLQTLIERPRLSSGEILGVLRMAARVSSSTDKRLVLSDLAERHRLDAAGREAYVAAARTIESDTDRALALEALLHQADSPRPVSAAAGARSAQTHGESRSEYVWNADIASDSHGRTVVIDAKQVVYENNRWNILSIHRGGRLLVEERRPSGETRRLEVSRGEGGRPVYVFRRNGAVETFSSEPRQWMIALVREFTGS